jgi:hypothetical protein
VLSHEAVEDLALTRCRVPSQSAQARRVDHPRVHQIAQRARWGRQQTTAMQRGGHADRRLPGQVHRGPRQQAAHIAGRQPPVGGDVVEPASAWFGRDEVRGRGDVVDIDELHRRVAPAHHRQQWALEVARDR